MPQTWSFKEYLARALTAHIKRRELECAEKGEPAHDLLPPVIINRRPLVLVEIMPDFVVCIPCDAKLKPMLGGDVVLVPFHAITELEIRT